MGEKGGLLVNSLSGSFAGALARIVVAPLDVIKIRFQLQNFKNKKYFSVLSAFRGIIKEEGLFSLWKGNLCATYLWIIYGGVQFVVYDTLKFWKSNHNSFDALWMGSISGVSATLVSYPFDIGRTQFSVQGKTRNFTGISEFFLSTIQRNGMKGLFAGGSPAILGIAPYMGINFYLFERLCAYYDEYERTITNKSELSLYFLNKSVCGAVSGGVSKLITYPFDTVKKVLQAQEVVKCTFSPTQDMRRYNGCWDCMRKMVQECGIQGLYRGIVPTTLKSMASSSILFSTYKTIKVIYSKYEV